MGKLQRLFRTTKRQKYNTLNPTQQYINRCKTYLVLFELKAEFAKRIKSYWPAINTIPTKEHIEDLKNDLVNSLMGFEKEGLIVNQQDFIDKIEVEKTTDDTITFIIPHEMAASLNLYEPQKEEKFNV